MTYLFSLVLLIFSLYLIFDILIVMCLGKFLLVLRVSLSFWDFYICSISRLVKCLATVSSHMFSAPFILLLRDFYNTNVSVLMFSRSLLNGPHFFSFFFLFIINDSHYSFILLIHSFVSFSVFFISVIIFFIKFIFIFLALLKMSNLFYVSILLSGSLNCSSGRLPISSSLSSSGVFACLFIWNMFLCCLIFCISCCFYFYVSDRLFRFPDLREMVICRR